MSARSSGAATGNAEACDWMQAAVSRRLRHSRRFHVLERGLGVERQSKLTFVGRLEGQHRRERKHGNSHP